jgi:hypothetical protein
MDLMKRLGPSLHSLVLFGSCLSPLTRRAGSIPDLFAFVDDLDGALARLGASALVRRAARWMPPTTLPLDGAAKLTLVALPVHLAAERDLYLAGRLSKRTEVLWTRDAALPAQLADEAARIVVEAAALGLPRRCPLDDAVLRCLQLSYAAEIRPERPAKARALYRAFPDYYAARFRPLLVACARARGVALAGDTLLDERPAAARASDERALRTLLRRSRARFALRIAKQALVYRGWPGYLYRKIGAIYGLQ